MNRYIWLCLILLSVSDIWAQDSLIYHNGRTVAYKKYNWIPHAVEILTYNNEWISVPADSLLGINMIAKEKTYFCIENPDTTDHYSLLLVERIESGSINLYRSRVDGLKFYIQKNGKILDLMSGNKDEGKAMLKSFVANDIESITYINSRDFSLKWKQIALVVRKYNERNFVHHDREKFEAKGTVYLYRTNFQDTKNRIKIDGYGEIHDLYINDFIVLDIPIEYPTRFKVYDGNNNNEVTVVGEFQDQYYEVHFDERRGSFVFDLKSGSELLYEFSKISNMVDDNFKNTDKRKTPAR